MDIVQQGPLRIGDQLLGKYEVRALLGKGGHAFVYECLDLFLDRIVALKAIKSPLDGAEDLAMRARVEARVLCRIEHDNLVRVIDAFMWEGSVYIVMEKLEGRTLREALKERGRLSVPEALLVGIQIARGMRCAHDINVIHRDLKPDNIFIQAGNRVKVVDFGIAKVLGIGSLGARTTQKDVVQGTWLYMSPEHLELIRFPGHQMEQVSSWSPEHGQEARDS